MNHPTTQELEAGLGAVLASPKDEGVLELIVRRPAVDTRETVAAGRLTVSDGLVGDTWVTRRSKLTADGSPHPRMQLTVMNTRAAMLFAQSRERWPLAGDQLFIDLDLSIDNLPAGTRLQVGGVVIEVSEQPHVGCAKFVSRFGLDAMKLVNSPVGRRLNLRGINAVVVRSGTIRAGDPVKKLPAKAT